MSIKLFPFNVRLHKQTVLTSNKTRNLRTFLNYKGIHSKWLLPIIVCIPLVLGDLGRIRLAGALFISVTDVVVAMVLVWGILKNRPWGNPVLREYLYWVGAITLMFVTSLMLRIPDVPLSEIAAALLYPVRVSVYFLLPVVLAAHITTTKSQNEWGRAIILTGVILSIAGLLQLIIMPNLQILEYIGYDPHFARVVSTWLDPNFFGMSLVAMLIFTLAQTLGSHHPIASHKEKFLLLILFSVTLICTFSRSAYLAAFIGVALYAVFVRSWKIAGALLFAALTTYAIFAFPRAQIDTARNIDREFSADLRLKSYGEAIQLFTQHPVAGIGFNLTRYEKNQNNMILDTQNGGNSGAGVDSSWLLILTTTGFAGLLIFLAFWIRIGYFILSPIKQKIPFAWIAKIWHKPSPIPYAACAVLIAWSINANFINSLFYANLMLLWQIIFSITLSNAKNAT